MAQRSGGTPHKYQQIAAELRAGIQGGEYPVGARLPTEDELVEMHGASKGTVVKALAALRELGLVGTRQGDGSYVLSEQPRQSETQQLGEQIATLRATVAELAKRVEAAEDGDLREIVSRIESNLIELYGKTGYEYPESTDDGGQRKRRSRHG